MHQNPYIASNVLRAQLDQHLTQIGLHYRNIESGRLATVRSLAYSHDNFTIMVIYEINGVAWSITMGKFREQFRKSNPYEVQPPPT